MTWIYLENNWGFPIENNRPGSRFSEVDPRPNADPCYWDFTCTGVCPVEHLCGKSHSRTFCD